MNHLKMIYDDLGTVNDRTCHDTLTAGVWFYEDTVRCKLSYSWGGKNKKKLMQYAEHKL